MKPPQKWALNRGSVVHNALNVPHKGRRHAFGSELAQSAEAWECITPTRKKLVFTRFANPVKTKFRKIRKIKKSEIAQIWATWLHDPYRVGGSPTPSTSTVATSTLPSGTPPKGV